MRLPAKTASLVHGSLAASERSRRLWTLVALAVVGIALLYAGISSYIRITGKGTDFNVFYLAARTLAERPADLYHFQAPRGPTYTYIGRRSRRHSQPRAMR